MEEGVREPTAYGSVCVAVLSVVGKCVLWGAGSLSCPQERETEMCGILLSECLHIQIV